MFTTQLDSKKIGANIKHLIKKKFQTQFDFAEACVSNYIINGDIDSAVRIVNRWLNGGLKKLSTICDLANILEVDVIAILF